MKQSSPNLKPKSAYHHIDRAHKLGVPRSNVVDLRKLAKTPPVEIIAAIPPTTEQTISTSAFDTNSDIEPSIPIPEISDTPIKLSWRERRRIAKQSKALISQSKRSTASKQAPQAAPVPSTAKLQRGDSEIAEITQVLEALDAKATTVKTNSRQSTKKQKISRQLWVKQWFQPQSITWLQTVKSMAVFLVLCTVVISPFASLAFYKHVSSVRDEVMNVSQEAVENFSQGSEEAQNLDFAAAQASFNSASSSFQDAHDQLENVNSALTPLVKIIPEAGDQYTSAESVLIAGENISAAAEDVTEAFTILSDIGALDDVLESNEDAKGVTDALVVAHSLLRPAVPRLERASLALEEVDVEHFPEEYRDELTLAKETVPLVARSLNQLLLLNESMLTILGHEEAKRYLVLFANNTERRGCLGFLGGGALVDIHKGEVSNMVIPGGGLYDMEGKETVKYVAPEPLHYANPYFHVWDANWWSDCPTSAQKVQKLYRQSGGSSVDGVLFLTPEVITKMLEVTGPISMEEYAGTVDENTSEEGSEDTTEDIIGDFMVDENYLITSENFYRITQAQAERKYEDTTQSKQFIADLTPKLLNRLFSLDVKDFIPVLQVVYGSLSEKDMVVYFNDPFLQNEMQELGWTGEIKNTSKDYLQVVHNNITGGKTDHVFDETIEHTAEIQDDGKIIDTVTITYVHNGRSDDTFENIVNKTYLQVYVPQGSKLITAEGFSEPDPKLKISPESGDELDPDVKAISGNILIDEATQTRINDEFNKTVFSNWIETAPGETSRVTLQYEVPFTLDMDSLLGPADSYSLLVQKQPGAFDPLVISTVEYPEVYTMRWAYPQNGMLNTTLTKDAYLGIVFER